MINSKKRLQSKISETSGKGTSKACMAFNRSKTRSCTQRKQRLDVSRILLNLFSNTQ